MILIGIKLAFGLAIGFAIVYFLVFELPGILRMLGWLAWNWLSDGKTFREEVIECAKIAFWTPICVAIVLAGFGVLGSLLYAVAWMVGKVQR